jgi:hypothetical protein
MLIHPMLITSHLSSWQGYLEYHEAMLLRLVGYLPSDVPSKLSTDVILGHETCVLLA